jgi:small subunit ribosomal protein S20
MLLVCRFPQSCINPNKIQGGENMANIKSAKKRIRVIEKKTLINRMVKSALKTAIKKFETSVVSGNADEMKATYVAAVKALDMAASKGVIHKNHAARKKSRMAAKLNAVNA